MVCYNNNKKKQVKLVTFWIAAVSGDDVFYIFIKWIRFNFKSVQREFFVEQFSLKPWCPDWVWSNNIFFGI